MKLTTEMLANCYEFLRSTQPYCSWNLPEPEDMRFRVTKEKSHFGWYNISDDNEHIIAITGEVKTVPALVETMAHEMIHLHQAETGMDNGAQHNMAFRKIARRVCRIHGYDPKKF